MHDFVVTESELLLEAPIIALRRDRVTMPGGEVAAREVVEHFGAVAIVALDEAGRVGMIRQYRHALGRRLLELPAGLLDIAEEDALSAARRELWEEAGLEARRWCVVADVVNSPGYCDEVCRVFLATELTSVERPTAEGDEEADLTFSWVPLAEARRRVVAGEIVNSIAIAGILAASEIIEGRSEARAATSPFDLRPTALARRRQRAGIVPDMKRLPGRGDR